MKKIIIIACLISFSFALNAQEKATKKFRLGAKVSPDLGWFVNGAKGYESNSVKFGFSWGFICDIAFAKNYFFSTGFNVSTANGILDFPHQMKITETDTVQTKGNLTRSYTMKYLEIPITLKMRTREFGKFTFFGQIGLGAGFCIKAHAEDVFTYGSANKLTTDDNIRSSTSFFRASLILGLGAEFSLGGSTSILMGLGYNNGFFDVLKGTNSISGVEEDAKSSFVDLSVGIIF